MDKQNWEKEFDDLELAGEKDPKVVKAFIRGLLMDKDALIEQERKEALEDGKILGRIEESKRPELIIASFVERAKDRISKLKSAHHDYSPQSPSEIMRDAFVEQALTLLTKLADE